MPFIVLLFRSLNFRTNLCRLYNHSNKKKELTFQEKIRNCKNCQFSEFAKAISKGQWMTMGCFSKSLKKLGFISPKLYDLYCINSLISCMQRRLWRQTSNRPTPLLTRSRIKDALVFASFEAYKVAGVVRIWKNGRNAFRRGAKIHFSEENILGLWAL